MKDIFNKYKSYKNTQNCFIIAMSLFLALWANILFQSSPTQQYLKANLLESSNNIKNSDIYITHNNNNNNSIEIKTNQELVSPTNIHFSILYDNSSLNTENINFDIDNYILNYDFIDNWILNIQLQWTWNRSIKAWENLVKIWITSDENLKSHINILNANFSDTSWKTYIMTSSWVSF